MSYKLNQQGKERLKTWIYSHHNSREYILNSEPLLDDWIAYAEEEYNKGNDQIFIEAISTHNLVEITMFLCDGYFDSAKTNSNYNEWFDNLFGGF